MLSSPGFWLPTAHFPWPLRESRPWQWGKEGPGSQFFGVLDECHHLLEMQGCLTNG